MRMSGSPLTEAFSEPVYVYIDGSASLPEGLDARLRQVPGFSGLTNTRGATYAVFITAPSTAVLRQLRALL